MVVPYTAILYSDPSARKLLVKALVKQGLFTAFRCVRQFKQIPFNS